MKKLLGLLGAVVLSATTASNVVACSSDMYSQNTDNPYYKDVDHSYDEQITQASLIARAKSLVVDDQYKLNDSITKDYVLKNNKIDNLVSTGNYEIDNTLINDKYNSLINEGDISNIASKSGITIDGTNGQEGGIFNFGVDGLINYVLKQLPSAVQGPLKAVIDGLMNSLGLNGTAANISDSLKPILQAMGQLNTNVAMQGIPFALGLIPDLSDYQFIFGLIDKLAKTLIDSSVSGPVDNLLTKLINDADMTSYGDKTVPQITDDIASTVGSLIKNGSDVQFGDILKFVSLTGFYMSFFDHQSTDSVLKQMTTNNTKKMSDSIFYKADEGKGFNLAPLLNEAGYYLGNGIDQNKILDLVQILFLKSDDGSSITLNSMGKSLFENNGPLLLLVNSLLGTKTISASEAEDLFLGTLINGDSTAKPTYSDSATAEKDLKSLYGENKPFDVIFNDWSKLASLNGADYIGKTVIGDPTLQAVFVNDNGLDTANLYGTMSLKTLVESVPLYKLLMLDSFIKKDPTVNPGFSADALKNNAGLLPNYAGHYTQESIAQLAQDLNSMFGLNSKDAKNEDLQYHYFDFTNMKQLIDDLLVKDTDDGSDSSLLSFILQNIGGKPSNMTDKSVQAKIAKQIGYYVGDLGNGTSGLNVNFVKVNSWMGKLLTTLVPELGVDKTKSDATVNKYATDGNADYYDSKALTGNLLKRSDALKFFASGLTNFVTNIIKPTDYKYWMMKVLRNIGFDNRDDGKSVWFFDPKQNNPWSNPKKYGIHDTKYFGDGKTVKSMTLTIGFNLGNINWLISGLKPNDTGKVAYTFTISRDFASDSLQFTYMHKEVTSA